MVSAEGRLRELGIVLPPPPVPLGAYVEAVRVGNVLYLSGTLPLARAHLGSMDEVTRVVRLAVSLVTTQEFTQHPKVADGASELLVDLFGPERKSTRLVYGVYSLPAGVCALVELTLEVSA